MPISGESRLLRCHSTCNLFNFNFNFIFTWVVPVLPISLGVVPSRFLNQPARAQFHVGRMSRSKGASPMRYFLVVVVLTLSVNPSFDMRCPS
ncbi:hypothetical protein B0H67DRAFT_570654 [Lasiosphaeris hirsuta]|uniref:Uncharacterized protein n=1 Tax=Lasiosphaeris hirsuta TaxID=260670 RepID=A0AA40B0P3_9PEZI|nr:hypothetical protein B0H67DRAFT_570654 [Lasiosphaeris hirsuta]